MGLFNQVGGMLGGGTESDANNGLMESALELIRNQEGGGLAGMLEAFKNKGFGDVMRSWISTGGNQPISASQLEQVLGNEKIQAIAAKVGISPQEMAQGLANRLPQLIDKLTPDGALPEESTLQAGLNLLKGKLFG